MIKVQKTDWGRVEWMIPDSEIENGVNSMTLGKVFVNPGAKLLPHVHYEEQFLYVLEGSGSNWVNGVRDDFVPGKMMHMPAGCTHEAENEGDTMLVHLLVSSPVALDPDSFVMRQGPSKPTNTKKALLRAIEAVRVQFLENSYMPFIIFDADGTTLYKNGYFPAYCENKCNITNYKMTHCIGMAAKGGERAENTLVCPSGLTVFQIPIMWDDVFIGSVQGGYLRRDPDAAKDIEMYNSPDSAAYGALQMLRKIAKAIRNFCEFDQYRQELLEKEQILTGVQNDRALLESQLESQNQLMTGIRINNHFLFNILNGMASQAISAGALPLYQSIIDLSKMLRYGTRVNEEVLALSQELDYLEAYLKLQSLRYGDEYSYEIKCSEALKNIKVPFNFLQPIVENAFTHGFSEHEEKQLSVNIKNDQGRVHITITHNGAPLTKEECDQIMVRMQSRSTHGLSMVYEKLRFYYGGDFEITMKPGKKSGMRIDIFIAKETKKRV